MSDIRKTLEERGGKYGHVWDNARITQGLMRTLKRSPNFEELSDTHVECVHMIFHKIARMVCGTDINYQDNATDMAGYATLLEDFMKKENADALRTADK